VIHRTLEQRLVHAAEVWKWQSAIKSTALIFSLALLVVLVLGGLAQLGWIAAPSLVLVGIATTVLVGVVAWIVMVVRAVERKLDRRWLAAAVEHDQGQLMDRFNAVVELDERPHDLSAAMYREAIEQQASRMLRRPNSRGPFPWLTTGIHVAASGLLLLLTIWFYSHFQPLRSAVDHAETAPSSDSEDATLSIPETPIEDSADSLVARDEDRLWGEIRISQPGRNLRVTRHEDIPLLIEAAADRPLADVFWSTSINVAEELRHDLPELEDPRYAVFQPTLKPDELGLDDWDLVHYRAAALAEDQTKYQSSTYFVEIIPSRDQLDQLPETAYQQLEQISDMIQQQQEVIRQTERITDPESAQQKRRLEALAEQEDRIATSAETFHREVPNRLPRNVTQPLASSIQAAREALAAAENALREHNPIDADDPEQTALSRLADARRQLADLVRDHPEAFQPSTLAAIDQQRDRGMTAADPEFAKLLESLELQTRETAAAATELEQLAADQQQLADQARKQTTENLPALATRQRQIQQRLEALRNSHPEAFADLTALAQQTDTALQRATDRLQSESSTAPDATQQAQQRLQQLAAEMDRRRMANELAGGDNLAQRLRANRQAYQAIEQQPQSVDSDDLQQTTEETRNLVDQLQQLAADSSPDDRDPEPASQSELATLLSPQTANQIAGQCDDISQATDNARRSTLAKGLGNSLQQLADALENDLANQESSIDQQQLASQLEQMQEREQGLQSARQSVQQARLQQRSIQRNAYTDRARKNKYPSLAQQQLELQQQLQQAIDQHPDAFDSAADESQSARSAMRQTAQALSSKDSDSPQLADRAAKQLQQLDDALQQQQQHHGISDQQQVREMLERLSERLEQFAKQPSDVTPQQKQQTSGQCKSAGAKACQMAGQSGGGAGGGQGQSQPSPSPSASSKPPTPPAPGGPDSAGSRQQQIDEASDRLAAAQTDDETAAAASDLQQQLDDLAAELGGQQPGGQQPGGQQPGGQQPGGQQPGGQQPGGQQPGGQQPGGQDGQASGGQSDGLRPAGLQAIERGMGQLETAARRSQQGTLTPEAGRALKRGGMADIVAGIGSHYGYNENSRAVVSRLREQAADPTSPVDMKTLQRLRQQIQSLQQDLTMQADRPGESEPTSRVDPTEFPPEYRESIQKYFQNLSEKR
jgi:hypothetical protein